ncbi:Light-induced protein 1-like [Rhynchospora pubera]|uniref:Light-induced protein 1-like n=1 Tax=Rhynchospora pubera TaxID=906938 RepID=A0AAV8CSK6_9POAL|nr:Light-induced protein 1-like [Rhynchospora pubera]
MQAATAISFTVTIPIKGTKNLAPRSVAKINRKLISPKAVAITAEPSVISYDSPISVFPMEACDLIGGDACDVRMFRETKLEANASRSEARVAREEVDRDYLEYNEPRTVFPGEACDNLGGEFCEAPYQLGVAQELVLAM